MAENKMKEVAKLLGLELDEEFRISGNNDRYKLTINGLMLYYPSIEEWGSSFFLDDLLIGELEIIKLPKPILDEKEKEFLSALIKPKSIRNRVVDIEKCCIEKYEYICINTDERFDYDDGYTLPLFEKGTMYTGMELHKKYSLEDLGI